MQAARVRSAARTAATLLLILGTLTSVSTPASEPSALSGQVRDTLGRVLSGVEILLIHPARAAEPVAVTRSDPEGRFTLEGLLPGPYQVAAVKEGYLTFVGRVNTLVQNTLDLVLHPALDADAERSARDASWALRLPRRSILRESDPEPRDVAASFEPGRVANSVSDAMRMQVDQMFSVSADLSTRETEAADVEATETRMVLASAMGERGRVLFEGKRERAGSAESIDRPNADASRQGAAVSVNLSYDTGPDAQLAVNAFYNQTDYELSAAVPELVRDLEQEQQTWGYDARWLKQIDAKTRLAVALDYHDTVLAGPGDPCDLHPSVTNPACDAMAARAVGAEGSYESVQYDRHAVKLSLRAEMQRLPSESFGAVTTGRGPDGDPLSGWNVQAEASDTWSVSVPFSLVYGLGYKQALMADEATLVVPRLGGSWSSDGWYLKALVAYHAVAAWDDPAVGREAPFQPAGRVGYEVEVEVPLVEGVHLVAGTTYSPIQLGFVGYIDGRPDEHPLYMTDGNTALWQHRVAIVEERGSSRTFLELARGHAEGTVAPLLPFEGPVRVEPGRSLRFDNGKLGVFFPTRGADFVMEYRRVEAEGPDPSDDAESVQESLEVRARKTVSVSRVPGDWRLLFALRLGSVEAGDPDYWASYEGGESIDALNRRLSAGVSVMFESVEHEPIVRSKIT